MKIGVCLKQVPDSETRVKINADGSGIVNDDIKWIINPYDEYALEAAFQLKEQGKADGVVILCMGDKSAEARIKDGIARGIKVGVEAVRLDDAAFAGSDALGTARVLAAGAKKAGVDLLLCGKQAIDDDNSQVPAMVAEFLGCAQITVVDKLDVEGGTVTANRIMGGGSVDMVQAGLPAVVTCEKGLNTPRFASLPGIMKAKRTKIAVWGVADLGLDAAAVGSAGAVVETSGYRPPPARPEGRIIDGATPEEKVQKLVQLLRNEAKAI
ncbi:MAG TPA: electron transfer flavoprotein subunit beta/FixA family protein [Myxococcota bacterium]|nr:electron transfer flavoprotein subunit beta/FixA family protein [Myxococcota bacterium]